jgi:hypothetical protein
MSGSSRSRELNGEKCAGGLPMATAIIVPGSRIADSLLAKLDAAQATVGRQPTIAVQLLESFIQEVQEQSGTSIEPENADRLCHQAQRIIEVVYRVRELGGIPPDALHPAAGSP